MNTPFGTLVLLLTTVIWGTAFLFQKYGSEALGPFAITALRNVLGGGFLMACVLVRGRARLTNVRYSIWAGVANGVPLFAAMTAQQIGIASTLPGVSAFLTTNYVLFVPLLVAALTRRLPRIYVLCGVALALLGSYLICVNGATVGLGRGEAWTILCAFLFAVQMLVVDHVARRSDILLMSAVSLFVCALVSAPFLLLPSEAARLSWTSLGSAALPLVYCGVVSSGIGYTLQNVGQARTPPALAAIVLSLESVFGALTGWLFRGDHLTAGQLAGCGFVFSAVLVTQIFDIIYAKSMEKQAK